jgi:anti-sigma regulatory factor (Ser/Thr protein kinase)
MGIREGEESCSRIEAADPVERVVSVRAPGDAHRAAHEARHFARRAGLGTRGQWEVSIVAAELATNVLKYAGAGELRLSRALAPRAAVVLEAIDCGRGVADDALALTDGDDDQPEVGLGLGLGSVHRLMDHVDIDTVLGSGTRIVARKFC